MPGAITRKARINKRKPERSRAQINAIEKFTRVSKAPSIGKEAIAKALAIEGTTFACADAPPKNARKRRASSPSSGSDGDSSQPSQKSFRMTHSLPVKRLCRRSDASGAAGGSSSTTEQAERLLTKLNLHSTQPEGGQLAPAPPKEPVAADLPRLLLDLTDLYAAFLKTLTLHVSHTGTNVPVDVAGICPSIAQAWGKRKVTLDDVRQCLGLLEWKKSSLGTEMEGAELPFALVDYGRGRVCLELRKGVGPALFSEAQLNRDLETALRALWTAHASRGPSTISHFLTTLPKADVKLFPTGLRALPNLSNAQRALEEIKNGAAKKRQQDAKVACQGPPLLNADGTRMNLLDRIRFKQLQQSQAARPRTKDELERQAALHRAGDVAAVIGMLATATAAGQRRVSFTMATILVKLKDSLRLPVSPEDGRTCVRLLASEIAPQWLRVVTVAGRENVVVQTDFQPSKSAMQERVKTMLQ